MKLIRVLLSWALAAAVGGCSSDPLRGHSDITFDISPAGDKVVFAGAGDGWRDLYLLQLTTLRVTRIAQTPEYERNPSFSPDGKSIVYAASSDLDQPDHIFIRSLDGRPAKRLTAGGQFYDMMPSFSADGSQIVFARAHRHRPYSMGGWTWDNWDAYVMKADGTNLRRVIQKNYYQLPRPQLSPAGTMVVFDRYESEGMDIFEIPSSGAGGPRPLTSGGHSSDPGFSRDGKQIVFISDRAKAYDYDLYVMDANGANLRRVTRNLSHNEHPVFATDARHIFFLSDAGGDRFPRYDLWEVAIDGTGLKRIADSSLFDDPLHWQPNESKLAQVSGVSPR